MSYNELVEQYGEQVAEAILDSQETQRVYEGYFYGEDY